MAKKKPEPVELDRVAFDAILNKCTTTIDGAWRVSFDLSSQAGPVVAELSNLFKKALKIVVIVTDDAADDKRGIPDEDPSYEA